MQAEAFTDVSPEKQAEVIQISDFQQNEFITAICDLGNFNGTATELLTLIKAMSSAPCINRLKPEGLTKLLHKRRDILQLKGINITIGKSGNRFIILQKTVQTVPTSENIEPVAHEPQTEFIWFQYFCKSGDLFTAYRHWAEQSNCIPNKQVPLAWCYAYKNWSWHDRKKLAIRKTEASSAISRSELQKQRFEQAREEQWQCREKLMEKIDKMINQPIPKNWKIKDLVAIIKMINDIDRYLFGYEFRELEAIAILYRSGMLTYEQMSQIDPTNKESVQELVEHFGLDTNWEVVFPYISEVLDKGISQFNQQGIKDYTDQIWLPQVLRLKPRQYDWIFCDEAQDLSPCQLELILMCRKPNGRIIFVGDPKQAIYGFAGADSKSMEKIEQRTNAIKLPLSICYRCPSSHIELAKTIVPQIEARENAPEGLVAKIDPSQLGSTLEADDLVICRKTAPLVKLCSSLLIKGISAKVKGSDIGKDLISLVRSAQEVEGFKFESFTTYLDKLEHKQIQKLQEKKAPISQLESIKDRIHAIRSAYRASSAKSLEQFCQELEQLFGEAENSVVMCTVHKAKGLEAERVFILEPENLPYLKAGQRDWEVEQENHLKYVALTRAKEELYFVMPESSPFAFPSQPHQNKSENKNDVKSIKDDNKHYIGEKAKQVLTLKDINNNDEINPEDDDNLIEMIQEQILRNYTE